MEALGEDLPEEAEGTNMSQTETGQHQSADPGDSSASHERSPSSTKRRQNAGVELHAILGPGTALHGDFSFAGRMRIDGQVEGAVMGGDLLIVGEGAKISGTLRARRVIVLGGYIEADISATESIELYIPAVVKGDMKSPQVYMDRGIQFHGTCDMTLDPPAVELTDDGGADS